MEVERALRETRKKKEKVLTDINKRQQEFKLLGHLESPPKSQNEKKLFLEEINQQHQYCLIDCCAKIFPFVGRKKVRIGTTYTETQNEMERDMEVDHDQSISSKKSRGERLSVKPQMDQIKNPQMNSGEWIQYLLKNLTNLDGLEWADNLLFYAKEHESTLLPNLAEDFKSSKFRSQIYFLNYTKTQLAVIPNRRKAGNPQRFSLKSLKSIKTELSPRRKQPDSLIGSTKDQPKNDDDFQSMTSEQRNMFVGMTSPGNRNESVAAESMLQDFFEGKVSSQREQIDDVNRYIYDLKMDKKNDTLEQMKDSTKNLFNIIKKQLEDPIHPLTQLAANFQKEYRKHYENQILQGPNMDEYFLIVKGKYDYDLIQITDEDKKLVDDFYLGEGLAMSKNQLIKQLQLRNPQLSMMNTINRATFSKRSMHRSSQIFDGELNQLKLAEEAIGEVKQLLSILYGCCIRFYNTVIKTEILEQMKEDLIETLTQIVFSRSFSKLLVCFCRVCTYDQEQDFRSNLKIFGKLRPKMIGIGQYFTLDASSKIEQIFMDQQMNENQGDVGGSIDTSNRKGSHLSGQKSSIRISDQEASINPTFSYIAKSKLPHIKEEEEEIKEEPLQEQHSPEENLLDQINNQMEDLDQLKQMASFKKHKSDRVEFEFKNNLEGKETLAHSHKTDEMEEFKEVRLEYDFRQITEEQTNLQEDRGSVDGSDDSDDLGMNAKVTSQDVVKRLQVKPYFQAIVHLLQISECNAPIEKIRCITRVSKLIVKAINRFWKGLHIKKDKLTIDGDTLLMIYIYINVKAKIINMFGQIKLMNEFATPYVRTTKMGYCLSSLEVAMNHILNFTPQDLLHDDQDAAGWSERRRTMSRSLRQTVYQSVRTTSLQILDDPFDQYFQFELK